MNQIEQYGISLYPLPDCDEDEDEDYREQCRLLKVNLDNLFFTPSLIIIFIAPAYSRVRYRSSNFRPSVRSFVRPCVRSSVRLSTFTSKFSFLDISDSCESETLHINCP